MAAPITLKYRNARGYTARVIAVREGRVLYSANDEDGRQIQNNGCVSATFFFANWQEA